MMTITTYSEVNGPAEIAQNAAAADTFLSRLKGLMFSPGFGQADALVLFPCNSIHTWFMRFPIDALCLDAGGAVVDVAHNLRPWRFFFPRGRAKTIIELPSGTLARCGVGPGDSVKVASPEQRM